MVDAVNMTIRLNPYLNFATQAREALEFYQSVLGGELDLSTFGEAGMADDPAMADLIMHGMLTTPQGMVVMAGDTPPGMDAPTTGTAVNLCINSEGVDLRAIWDGLSEGGEVAVPFSEAPWGDVFGLVNDRFGIAWLFNQAPAAEA